MAITLKKRKKRQQYLNKRRVTFKKSVLPINFSQYSKTPLRKYEKCVPEKVKIFFVAYKHP